MSLLSVIIPIYNMEKYIGSCLESVTCQTFGDMEIIIIDDGSTDRTADICSEYSRNDPRIIYKRQERKGPAEARNLGIEIAKGEYLTFIDSDDRWAPDFARTMLEAAQKADIAICDIIYTDACGIIPEQVSEIRLPAGIPVSAADDTDLINKGRAFLWGKIYKTALFRENNIRLTSGIIEDFPVTSLLIAKADSVIRVPRPLYYYLRNRDENAFSVYKISTRYPGGIEQLCKNFEAFGIKDKFSGALFKLAYSQARFALKKTRENAASEKDYTDLENRFISILKNNWPDKALPFGKKFAYKGSSALAEGIGRLIVSPDLSVTADEESADYIITDEIIKNKELSGEELYWHIADEILFGL